MARLNLAGLDRVANELAFRLHELCNLKGWAEEARAYNMWKSLWSDPGRRAEDHAATVDPTSALGELAV